MGDEAPRAWGAIPMSWSVGAGTLDFTDVLRAGERVLQVATGMVLESRQLASPGWTIVLTDQRLLCMRADRRSARQVEVKRELIRSAYQRRRWLGGVVVIGTAGGTVRIRFDGNAGAVFLRAILGSPPVEARPAWSGEPAPMPQGGGLQERVDALERQVDRIQDQVDFLERLLESRPSLSPSERRAGNP